jgi:hypothetical protein
MSLFAQEVMPHFQPAKRAAAPTGVAPAARLSSSEL